MTLKVEDKNFVSLQEPRKIAGSWRDADNPVKRSRRKLHDIVNKCEDVEAMKQAIDLLLKSTKLH